MGKKQPHSMLAVANLLHKGLVTIMGMGSGWGGKEVDDGLVEVEEVSCKVSSAERVRSLLATVPIPNCPFIKLSQSHPGCNQSLCCGW